MEQRAIDLAKCEWPERLQAMDEVAQARFGTLMKHCALPLADKQQRVLWLCCHLSLCSMEDLPVLRGEAAFDSLRQILREFLHLASVFEARNSDHPTQLHQHILLLNQFANRPEILAESLVRFPPDILLPRADAKPMSFESLQKQMDDLRSELQTTTSQIEAIRIDPSSRTIRMNDDASDDLLVRLQESLARLCRNLLSFQATYDQNFAPYINKADVPLSECGVACHRIQPALHSFHTLVHSATQIHRHVQSITGAAKCLQDALQQPNARVINEASICGLADTLNLLQQTLQRKEQERLIQTKLLDLLST